MGECEPGCQGAEYLQKHPIPENEEFKYKKLLSAVYYQINELLVREEEKTQNNRQKFNKNSELIICFE